MLLLFQGGQKPYFHGDPAVLYDPVRGFYKAEFIYPAIGRKGRNKTYVRPFRRLYGAYPPIVGWMHVPDLKPCPLPCKSPWSKGGEPPLMGYL